MDTNDIILITGATSGIGYDTARALAELGYRVYGAGRHTEALQPLASKGVKAVSIDLTDPASIDRAVAEVGRVDILINNAGYGSLGPIENVTDEEARRQMDVNVFGLMALTRKILPQMRQRHYGRIINVSSIAGRVVSLMGGWYHASKFALEALSDALRREVKPFNIDVILIEPGAINTPWAKIAAKHLEQSSQDTDYEAAAALASRFMRRLYSSKRVTPPEKVARTIVRAVKAEHPRARYRVGLTSTSQLWLKALVPTRLRDSIFMRLK